MPSLLAALLLAPAPALAWPASGAWADLLQASAAMTDAEEDQATSPAENAWDLVGNASNPVARWYLDEDNLYLRMLLNADPGDQTIPYSGAWGLLFETNGDDDDFEHSVALSNSGLLLTVYANTNGGDGPGEEAETPVTSFSAPLTTDLARVVLQGTIFGSAEDALLDLALPLQDLYDEGVIVETGTFQICVATSADADYTTLNTDTSAHDDGAGLGTLPECLSDAISVDGDADGLPWFEEVEDHGTDPRVADTDGDNLDDGEEVALQDMTGCPDPLDEDSDADGLLDGDEGGFGADPCDADTDGDTLSDGDEVAVGLDPTLADSDKDGIDDPTEFACTLGGKAATWDDRDADGIPDTEEGDANPDGDGDPAWCDTDSDGDGHPDAEEGTGDIDCDDVPNWLDTDDSDGSCDTDTDTDTDADTDTDTDTDADSDADTDTAPACDSADIFCQPGKLTGGGCAAAPRDADGLLALLAGLALCVPRRRWRWLRAGLLPLALILPAAARAQGLDAQTLQPAIDGDRLLALDDAVFSPEGEVQLGGGVLFGLAQDPIVYRLDAGGERDVVSTLGTLDALVFFRPVSRLRLGLDLPLVPVDLGPEVDDGHLLGDLALDTRVVVLDRRDGLGLSASARVELPTGRPEAWTGEGVVTARALLGASTTLGWPGNPEAIVLAANGGLATGSGADDLPADLAWGMRVPFGVGASYAFAPPIWASAEVSGSWVFGNPDQPGALPAEALLALRLRPTKSPLMITLGGGLPLSQGIGTPALRGLAGLAWVPRPAKRATWNLPDEGSTGATPIPAGKGRVSVLARSVRGDGGEPDPVQATVVVLGTISDLDRRHHEVGRPPQRLACKGDGRAVLVLDPGEYTVRVLAEGFEPDTRTLTVAAGHDQPLTVELIPTVKPRFSPGAGGEVALLPSVGQIEFRPDSRTLSGPERDELSALASWWARHLPGTFLVITGKATKDELSREPALHEQRALAIKEAMALPTGFTRCVTHRAGTCGNPRDEAECRRVTVEVTDLACPDLKPPSDLPIPE